MKRSTTKASDDGGDRVVVTVVVELVVVVVLILILILKGSAPSRADLAVKRIVPPPASFTATPSSLDTTIEPPIQGPFTFSPSGTNV